MLTVIWRYGTFFYVSVSVCLGFALFCLMASVVVVG